MRSLWKTLIPALVVMAVLGAIAGFLVSREIAPVVDEHTGVSVVALPATPAPTPSATPSTSPKVRVHIGGRGGTDGVSNCPAGCTCESRPPAGIVIVCR